MNTIVNPVLHYSIQDRLGVGGMGVVYRAMDTRLDRPVALKFLPEAMSINDNAKQRLTLEARAAAKLDHPNIGVIHDIEEADGRLFIVMALYEGESLKDRLQQGQLEIDEALGLAVQACRGLETAHEKGLIHRDIKPANLFLSRGGLLKILDFGLVKLEQAEGLTMPGSMVGTPEYMAPEQIRGRAVDRRADLWALGAVLYEMITSVSPFRANGELPAIILQVMNGEPRPIGELRSEVPDGLASVLEKALAKDREERYDSARELAGDLEALLGAGSGQERPQRSRLPGKTVTGSESRATPDSTNPVNSTASPVRDSVVDLTLDRPGTPQASALLEPVPRVPRFIGRENVLAELRGRLERDRLVAIRGIAGTGKSVLGSQLARESAPEENIFWFTFDSVEKNNLDSLFWSLAAFLRGRGETLLWRYLQGEIEAHKPLDMTVRMNLFLSSLISDEFVFCIDDLHLVAAVPQVADLLKTLQKHVARDGHGSHVAFVLMGRELPVDIDFRAESLVGFSAQETADLLASREVEGLSAELARRLCERTGGNPTILDLAASALSRLGQDQSAQADFIESMTGRNDIRDYVMRHIYADLPATEKSVLDALSIFSGSVELDAAEETLLAGGLQGIVPCVDNLIQKAIVHETGKGFIYCHELVREFCYRSLERPIKRDLHEHAARYYEERKNILRASHHYLQLGEAERALELLTANVQAIIHSGGASSLIDQLAGFDLAALDEEYQMAALRAKGEAHFVRGEFREAARLYREALDEAFEEADEAELLCRIASALDKTGDHEGAIGYARRSLNAFQSLNDESGIAQVRRVLGWAHYRLGRLEEAQEEFEAGFGLAEKIDDRSLLAQLQQGLGVIDLRAGRLEAARARLDASRRAFREQRDRIGEAEAAGNLAWVYGRLGNVDRELALDRKVLEILEHIGDVGNLLIAYNNIGDLYFRNGGHAEAIEQYQKLAELAQRIEHTGWLISAGVGQAENHLALGEIDAALERAQAAFEQVDEVECGVAVERAMSSRVLGEIHLALDRPAEARRWFETAMPPLQEAREEEELIKARRGLETAQARLEAEDLAPEPESEHEKAFSS
ncbi:MAG: protein kinase [Trueperaceae bacterium]